MKRIIAIVLVLTMALALLSACAKTATATAASGTSAAASNGKTVGICMTVFLDAKKLAAIVVPLVDDLLAGKTVSPDTTYDNGTKKVPTKTYDPYLIDKTNVDYLVEVGFYTHDEIYG